MKTRKIICFAAALTMLMTAFGCTAGGESKTGSAPQSSAAASEASENSVADTKDDVDEDEVSIDIVKGSGYDTNGDDYGIDTVEGAKSLETADEAPAEEAPAAEAPAEGVTYDGAKGETKKNSTERGATDAEAEKEEEPAESSPEASGEVSDTSDSSETSESSEISEPSESSAVSDQTPKAGQLTAGEWNDNDNFGFFSNLVDSGKITFPSYGLDPRYRTAVTVKNNEGKALPNVKAELLDEGDKVLWTGITDKEGNAYLFCAEGEKPVSVRVTSGDKNATESIKEKENRDQSNKKSADNTLEIKLDAEPVTYKNTDIMFIMDATGSMSDEMLFLQSEFTAITEKVGSDNARYSVNFYRDKHDEYITKCYSFSKNIKKMQKLLNSESADGGGDLPEAVAEILDKTMVEAKWRTEAVKLAFMIFDAPPHEGTQTTILNAVKTAAEKGIRLVPVVSSNSDRSTELFARALAVNTGGTYVFLTDDSGIGDSHLEPIIGSYKVEKLYDIIIRVINDYKQG